MRPAAVLLVLVLLAPSTAAATAAVPAPARVLVSLEVPLAELAGALPLLGARAVEDFPAAQVALVEAPPAALPLLRSLPGVAGVYAEEPLALLLSTSRPAVGVTPALWDAGYDGSGVTVAVVDSGLDAAHPALQGRVARAVRIDGGGVVPAGGDASGHGTHIAGIIGGTGLGSPGQRHAGMAPAATLVGVDISASFTTTNAVRAFQWLHDHAPELDLRVVSNSWGREKEDAAYDANDPVIRASDALVQAGMVVVFSAGNRGPGPATLTVEAQNPNVLTVGAANDEGRIEAYSSRGPARHPDGRGTGWTKPDVTAPGTHITSTAPGGGYAVLNGTSMAAPHVAGIAALMLEANPGLTPGQVKALLQRTARDRGASGADDDHGAGFVDATRAVQAARASAPDRPPEREPFRHQGDLGPAVPALGGPLAAPPRTTPGVRVPLTVPAGTVGLELALRWDDPRTRLTATLEKDGQRLGPFRGAAAEGAWQVLRLRVAEPLDAGTWTLVAAPEQATLGAHYEVAGELLVRHALPEVPDAPPLVPGSFPALALDAAVPPAAPPLAALAALPLALLVGWGHHRARRSRGR